MTDEQHASLDFLLRLKMQINGMLKEVDDALEPFTDVCKKCEQGAKGNFHMTMEECSKSGGAGFSCKAPQDHHKFEPAYER
jgi:hypothetical protein